MKAKLTAWFPPHIKPVRVGMYECQSCPPPDNLHYWDGKKWCYARNDIYGLPDQDTVTWRGLANDPRGSR